VIVKASERHRKGVVSLRIGAVGGHFATVSSKQPRTRHEETHAAVKPLMWECAGAIFIHYDVFGLLLEAPTEPPRSPRGAPAEPKRSPDSDSARRELSKSGLASHFGPQTCDFASRGGGPRLEVLPVPSGIRASGERWLHFTGASLMQYDVFGVLLEGPAEPPRSPRGHQQFSVADASF
jgi:hypothetical protein